MSIRGDVLEKPERFWFEKSIAFFLKSTIDREERKFDVEEFFSIFLKEMSIFIYFGEPDIKKKTYVKKIIIFWKEIFKLPQFQHMFFKILNLYF